MNPKVHRQAVERALREIAKIERITKCSECGIPLFIRPWLLEAAQKHNLKIVCPFCADTKKLKGRIIQDIAKIELAKEAKTKK
jgi:uncharacterized Zn finger protein (UPF0148 family)